MQYITYVYGTVKNLSTFFSVEADGDSFSYLLIVVFDIRTHANPSGACPNTTDRSKLMNKNEIERDV